MIEQIAMTRADRDAWVADLRANPDKQGKRALQNSDGTNCCLGRYCIVKGVPFDGDGFEFKDSAYGVLSLNVFPGKEWSEAQGLPERITVEVANLNDNSGMTFAEIADWIEANVPVKEAA